MSETAISIAINAVLSVAFALLVFGGRESIDLAARDVLFDMAPQSFMVAFMGTLVPGLLTRKRLAAGRIAGFGERVVPGRPVLRAFATAVAAAAAGTGLIALVQPDMSVALPVFVAAKAVYGGVLAAIVTPLALAPLLRDPV
ncbi:hypothetical protein [Sphingomonas sp. G-3-2-10]|uniref:hypothetical protein n=1 Tax=Sphingomonas sp. G-3-2-10 TaxID=2728838 RepID=UPI00146B9D59|nr:hypothetical protein [Sphingomonas sp. G-3-2-10]NML05871.1 hypothetical protein [Sphingomonas sp. G-3-2-10]